MLDAKLTPGPARGASALVIAVLLVLVACGGDDDGPTPGDAGGGVDSGGGIDAGPGVDSGPGTDAGPAGDAGPGDDGGPGADGGPVVGPCPVDLPVVDATCSRDGLVCAYGDDPRPLCRPTATCGGGTWTLADPGCDPLPDVTCPATREDAADQRCSPDGAYCAWDGIACHCTNCTSGPSVMCGGPRTWHCDAPHPDMDCPPAIPNLGTTCATEAQFCSYDCEEDMSRTCTGGVWVASSAPGGCPRSTRRAKRDIRYLTPQQIEDVAGQVRATRLATWEYIDPALDGRRHLGFILEDQPGSWAEDPEARQVDLYGYTSMLLAATQAQAREIEALEREVRALRRDMRALRGH